MTEWQQKSCYDLQYRQRWIRYNLSIQFKLFLL